MVAGRRNRAQACRIERLARLESRLQGIMEKELSMKRSRMMALMAGLTLAISALSADAVCRPNPCYRQMVECRASGIPYYECYARYEDCLMRYGCPIP